MKLLNERNEIIDDNIISDLYDPINPNSKDYKILQLSIINDKLIITGINNDYTDYIPYAVLLIKKNKDTSKLIKKYRFCHDGIYRRHRITNRKKYVEIIFSVNRRYYKSLVDNYNLRKIYFNLKFHDYGFDKISDISF